MAQPTINEIAKAIVKLSNELSDTKLAQVVASYLINDRRSAELDKIMRQVALIRYNNGISEVTATSAVPLTEKVKVQIKLLSDQKQIIINEVTDKSVIGGIKLEANDYYLDLTIRSRLNKLKVGV